MAVFDLHCVVKSSLSPLLTLLIASVKCQRGFNRLLYCKVFFKAVQYSHISIHLEFVFIILELNVYLSL